MDSRKRPHFNRNNNNFNPDDQPCSSTSSSSASFTSSARASQLPPVSSTDDLLSLVPFSYSNSGSLLGGAEKLGLQDNSWDHGDLSPPATKKKYAPAHYLEAVDFHQQQDADLVSVSQSTRKNLQNLPVEVLVKICSYFNVKDLARMESVCVRFNTLIHTNSWPSIRSLKISHVTSNNNNNNNTSIPPSTAGDNDSNHPANPTIADLSTNKSDSATINLQPISADHHHESSSSSTNNANPSSFLSTGVVDINNDDDKGDENSLRVAISVGHLYYEDTVTKVGVAKIVSRLTGLRTMTFGVQARIQLKSDYEDIYKEERAKEYREKSGTLMEIIVQNLPRTPLQINSLTVGSYFEMSPWTATLVRRLSTSLRSITMSFRWVHRTAGVAEIQRDTTGWSNVWSSIKECTNVEVLKVYKTSMPELGYQPVLNAIRNKPNLSRLCLVCEGFTDLQMAEIIASIPSGNLKVLFLEPNGGSALERLRSPDTWERVSKTLPTHPNAHLEKLRKFGFSSRDHLSLPGCIEMFPNLWEILIVGRHTNPELLDEVSDLTYDYLMARYREPTVKPICIRIHTEDDKWKEEPQDTLYHAHRERDQAFGKDLMKRVGDRTKCHTVKMDSGKWGFRLGNASVVVTSEKPSPPTTNTTASTQQATSSSSSSSSSANSNKR